MELRRGHYFRDVRIDALVPRGGSRRGSVGSQNWGRWRRDVRPYMVGFVSCKPAEALVDLVTCYKIVFGLTCLRCEQFFFSFSPISTTRGHPYKLYVPFTSNNTRKHFCLFALLNPGIILIPISLSFSSLKSFKRSDFKNVDISCYFKSSLRLQFLFYFILFFFIFLRINYLL